MIDVMPPQIAPSLFAAFCLICAVALGAYGAALVGTQANILPPVLYSKVSETGADLPAAAISLVLVAISTCVVSIAEVARCKVGALLTLC